MPNRNRTRGRAPGPAPPLTTSTLPRTHCPHPYPRESGTEEREQEGGRGRDTSRRYDAPPASSLSRERSSLMTSSMFRMGSPLITFCTSSASSVSCSTRAFASLSHRKGEGRKEAVRLCRTRQEDKRAAYESGRVSTRLAGGKKQRAYPVELVRLGLEERGHP